MNNSQRAAGIGALLQGIFFVIVLVLIFAVLPRFGLQGPNDFADPTKVLPFVASQPLVAFWLFPGDILFAVFLIMTVMGLHEHLQNNSPTLIRLATAAGLIATALILANGTLGASLVQLAHNYPQNRDTAATAFLTLSLVSSNGVGLVSGGIFAYGWWAVLVSWVALRAGTFPKALNYVGMLFGVAGIGAIFILPLGFLGPVVGIVWCLWLGVVLLRA
jgi:hypothetical protein